MNAVALCLALAALGVVLVSALLGLLLGAERRARWEAAVAWLLRITYLDFVQKFIFLKPWKPYVEQIGLVIWIVLAFAVGRYLITDTPTMAEVPGPYLPAIGYVYVVSVLYIVRSTLRLFARDM